MREWWVTPSGSFPIYRGWLFHFRSDAKVWVESSCPSINMLSVLFLLSHLHTMCIHVFKDNSYKEEKSDMNIE